MVEVEVVSVRDGGASLVAVGIVRSGVVRGIAPETSESEPQAPSPADRARPAIRAKDRDRIA